MDDPSGLIGIVVFLLPQPDLEIGIGRQVRIDLIHKVRHRDQRLVLVEQASVDQRDQKHDDRQHRHRRTGHDGNGRHTAAVGFLLLLPALAGALRILGGPPLLAPANGAGIFRLDARHTLRGGSRMLLDRRFRGLLVGHEDLVHHGVAEAEKNGRILAEFLHIIQHSRRGGVTVRRLMGHGFHNDLLQAAGDIGIEGGGHSRAAVDMLDGHRHRGFPVIGRAAGHHLIHHNAQGIDIRPVIHPASLGLLR